MPYYKHHKIELTPKRHDDGTWQCPYRVIEFRVTSFANYKGCAEGRFAYRGEAAAAAMKEAKRIVDELEVPTRRVWVKLRIIFRDCMTMIKKILGLGR